MAKNKNTSPVSFFNSNLITIISISLVLFLIGVFFIVGLMSHDLSVYMKENLSLTIVLKDNVKSADIRQMQHELNVLPFIKTSRYISKTDAAREMADELGEDPQVFLGFNPFLASIEVKLKSEYTHADSLKMVEKKLTASTNVSELVYQKDMMYIVNNNIRQILTALTASIIILILISFTLISNTIRLLIYSRRFLIYTMRLVGATPGFIRKPFIKHSIVNGLFAAVLTILMLIAALYYLESNLEGLGQLMSWHELVVVFAVLLVVGVLISLAAAYFAVNRYLRMERGKLYYI
ncbi:MAG: permease-like cell division protein FtsX [Tannerella sp.]|jgi:cell division transport system permease protein|nr:permease-like cell division protein FtsX [Tannerella sp.]